MTTRRATAGRPNMGGWRLSNDVRIRSIRVKEGRPDPQAPAKRPKKSYVVRWKVGPEEHQRTYATRALADAERSKLIGHQQRGTAFDIDSGLPEPELRKAAVRSWFEHMCLYTDRKWPRLAPTARKSVADALATVTPALLATDRGAPHRDELRELVWTWAARPPARADGPPPEHLRAAARWLEQHTISLPAFGDRQYAAALTLRALDQLALKLDGTPAAPNTIARRKAVFYNILQFAVEQGLLSANPIDHVSWTAPKAVETVDRRSVVNMAQGRLFLAAVGEQGQQGERLVAFFACMLYAALRPSESIGLREPHLAAMPEQGWGEFLLARSTPRAGRMWSDSGQSREERGLKHRAEGDTRAVPAHPELVTIIRRHVDRFGYGPGGRLFSGPYGGLIDESTYLPIFHRARAAVLTPGELESPLAARPYDLRHTAVSTWLNAGVPATQVAEWAGHSVAVLLKVYAKCIVGQDKSARDRIDIAFKGADA